MLKRFQVPGFQGPIFGNLDSGCSAYLNPKSSLDNCPLPMMTAMKAIVLHTLSALGSGPGFRGKLLKVSVCILGKFLRELPFNSN